MGTTTTVKPITTTVDSITTKAKKSENKTTVEIENSLPNEFKSIGEEFESQTFAPPLTSNDNIHVDDEEVTDDPDDDELDIIFGGFGDMFGLFSSSLDIKQSLSFSLKLFI